MKIAKSTSSTSTSQYSNMGLEQLKQELIRRGDAWPKYMFSEVEATTDLLDYWYVFWLDLMGARNMMKLSLPRAARSVMKIHAAALHAKELYPKLEINPVMDGVYGFVKSRRLLENCLQEIMGGLANSFVREKVASSRFMVRAGVAFGPLIPGTSLAAGSKILTDNTRYLGGTAIGMGISHAYEAESLASPFGIYIHESARAFAPQLSDGQPYRVNLWRWFKEDDPLTWATRRTLLEHFDWLDKNPVAAQYDPDAMRRHKNLAIEYFRLYQLTNGGGRH